MSGKNEASCVDEILRVQIRLNTEDQGSETERQLLFISDTFTEQNRPHNHAVLGLNSSNQPHGLELIFPEDEIWFNIIADLSRDDQGQQPIILT